MDSIERKIAEFIETSGVPAFAVAVVRPDSPPAFVCSAGTTPQSLFPVCSTTKLVTATLLLKLAESKKLDLAAPVHEYVPWLKYPLVNDGAKAKLSLLKLLSHQGGVSDEPDFIDAESLGDYVKDFVPTLQSIAEPGKVFWYNNASFNLAGFVAEQATGSPFSSLVAEQILKPAGMTRSGFSHQGVTPPAFGERMRSRFAQGASGLVSSLEEMARFASALMGKGQAFSKQNLHEMSEHRSDAVTLPTRYYGLGMVIEYWNGHKIISHGGGYGAYGSYFAMLPEKNTAVVSLFNHPAGYGLTAQMILGWLLGDEKGSEAPPAEAEVGDFRDGCFVSADGATAELRSDAAGLQIHRNGEIKTLNRVSRQIFESEDASTIVGIVAGNPRFIMLNEHPIGLVSAVPMRRIE